MYGAGLGLLATSALNIIQVFNNTYTNRHCSNIITVFSVKIHIILDDFKTSSFRQVKYIELWYLLTVF